MAGIIHPTTTGHIGFGFGTYGGFYPDKTWHGVFYESFHGGIDYWGPLGYPIWAAANGTVKYAGWAVPYIGTPGGFGVVIQHGPDMLTVYGHMDSVSVSAGQQVVAGQNIGKMGQSGVANGVVHLHFEVWTTTDAWGHDVDDPNTFMHGGSNANTLAMDTYDIPWIEPEKGTAITMAICTRQGNGSYALPTGASTVTAVYYDRMKVQSSGYTINKSNGAVYIVPAVALDVETEVRADYVT